MSPAFIERGERGRLVYRREVDEGVEFIPDRVIDNGGAGTATTMNDSVGHDVRRIVGECAGQGCGPRGNLGVDHGREFQRG